MNPSEYQRLREVFLAAREREGEEREIWLVEVCGDDEGLLAEVRRLLASDEEGTRFLGLADAEDTSGLSPGDRIGPYTLHQLIGEGSFAEVFMAEQHEPVRRRVAMKLLKPGMDSREIIARFEAERQALALMQHSGIAKIFDAGISENGRSWFAMEYVDGVPITEYCDTCRLGLAERIDLFIEVCGAVAHAHQKGVIHRDLKPSNILVGMAEGKALPKVIDFGIAKATGGRLTEKTVFTVRGLLIGTPAYMSPEQADMSGTDIDTRSDVYSLGILLYELLSGEPPFDSGRLGDVGYAGIQRIIREEEPSRPSNRSITTEDAEKIAELRSLDTGALRKRLKGDLDWIAMKAIEKDRVRRYPTVQELAADLGRHLADEPVEAGPPSVSYRLVKFARRHRIAAAAGSLVLLALAGGIAATTWQWRQARLAEGAARTERDRAQRAEQAAVTERDRAKKAELTATQHSIDLERLNQDLADEKSRLEKVASFQQGTLLNLDADRMGFALVGLFRKGLADHLRQNGQGPDEIEATLKRFTDLIVRASPTDATRTMIDTEILKIAAHRIGEDFTEDPLTEASLRMAVGQVYEELGLYAEALPLFRRALAIRKEHRGEDHSDTLDSINKLGMLLFKQGKIREAGPYLHETVEGFRRLFGDENPATFDAIGNLGTLLQRQGKWEEAEAHLRQAMEGHRRVLGDQHRSTLGSFNNIAGLLFDQGKLKEAELYYRKVLEGSVDLLGAEHPDTLVAASNLAVLLEKQDRLEEAERFSRMVLKGRRSALGNDHPDTLGSLSNTGFILLRRGDLVEAERHLREAMVGYQLVSGSEHPRTLSVMFNMSHLFLKQGRFDEAEEMASGVGKFQPDNAAYQAMVGRLLDEIAAARKKKDGSKSP